MFQIEPSDIFEDICRRISAFGVAVIVLAMMAIFPATAREPQTLPTINVSATGHAQMAPDMAILNLSVVSEAKTARQALNANNRTVKNVIEALGKSGIDPKDLQTANFNIQPRYRSLKSVSTNNEPPQIIGYRVSNGLSVKVRDLAILGPVLDKVVTLRVNSGGNVQFKNQNPDIAIARARSNAMKKAIAKARTLVEAAGVKLGEIISISEGPEGGIAARGQMAQMSFKNVAGGLVPMAAGENIYTVTINASWRIDQ